MSSWYCNTCVAKCCSTYILDDKDWQEVADNMGISFAELNKKHSNRIKYYGPIRYCIFVDTKDFVCSIYENRPTICSQYFCPNFGGYRNPDIIEK